MQWLQQISQFLSRGDNAVVTAVVCAAVWLLITLIMLVALVSLKRRYAFLLRHEDTQTLGDVFSEVEKRVARLETDQRALDAGLQSATRTLIGCVQHVGVVRYDAFDDVGGQQSYAVALLDDQDNGVVFSSVYSRLDCRTYAKALEHGSSLHNLTAEEEEAVRRARQAAASPERPR